MSSSVTSCLFFFLPSDSPCDLHSFPTRRSSDLCSPRSESLFSSNSYQSRGSSVTRRDRKSTRLNSSHLGTSYAVFCLKKKNDVAGEDNDRIGEIDRPPLPIGEPAIIEHLA